MLADGTGSGVGEADTENERDPRIVFMHLPKCAGTSLHDFLARHVAPGEICPMRYNDLYRLSPGELDRYRLFSAHTDFGGVRRIPEPTFRVTVLREPRARILSLHAFWRGHPPGQAFRDNLVGPMAAHLLPLEEFLACSGRGIPANLDNVYVRNFLGPMWIGPEGQFAQPDEKALEIALENLRSFDVIGFVDRMGPLFEEVAAGLGVAPPEQPPHVNRSDRSATQEADLSPVASAALDRLTRLDAIFYEEARRIVAERAAEVAPAEAPARRSLLGRLRAMRGS